MKNQDIPLYQDLDYIQGQIASLQALILAMARTQDQTDFRENSLKSLESLKTVLLNSSASDIRILAIDSCINWVSSVTEDNQP